MHVAQDALLLMLSPYACSIAMSATLCLHACFSVVPRPPPAFLPLLPRPPSVAALAQIREGATRLRWAAPRLGGIFRTPRSCLLGPAALTPLPRPSQRLKLACAATKKHAKSRTPAASALRGPAAVLRLLPKVQWRGPRGEPRAVIMAQSRVKKPIKSKPRAMAVLQAEGCCVLGPTSLRGRALLAVCPQKDYPSSYHKASTSEKGLGTYTALDAVPAHLTGLTHLCLGLCRGLGFSPTHCAACPDAQTETSSPSASRDGAGAGVAGALRGREGQGSACSRLGSSTASRCCAAACIGMCRSVLLCTASEVYCKQDLHCNPRSPWRCIPGGPGPSPTPPYHYMDHIERANSVAQALLPSPDGTNMPNAIMHLNKLPLPSPADFATRHRPHFAHHGPLPATRRAPNATMLKAKASRHLLEVHSTEDKHLNPSTV